MSERAKAARGAPGAVAGATLLQSVCDRLPVGFALFDAGLGLAAWNARFAALQGYPRKLVRAGTPLEAFVRFDVERGGHGAGGIELLARQRLAALKRGRRTEREQALPDGRILRIASEPVPGAGVLVTCEDVTENRGNEERLRESAARYELALRGISEGFYDWDVANGTIDYSERVRHALGFSPEELRTPEDWRTRIHPDDLARYDATHVAHFKGQTERFECDYRYRGRDGGWRWARQHGVALRDARGRAYRMVGSTGDITALKRVEAALRESEERHAFAMRAAVEGIYEWNVDTDALFLSEQAKAFFALPAEKLGPEDWNARIHPDDLETYRRATVDHFKGRTPHLELEYRIRDAAGGDRWVLDRGLAVRSTDGRVTRLIGALSDITQRKRAEIELRRARDDATAALGEQTALREVLEAISRSAFDLDAVLRTLIEHATLLAGAEKGFIFRLEGETYRLAVDFGAPPEFREFIARNPIRADSGGVVGLTAREGRTVHVEDALTDPRFRWPESQRLGGFRTVIGVPMLREGAVIGVIALWKDRVEPFTQAQIDLVTTFSNQALVAIENARLFNETKEALERQTATAEILKVISSSPTDVQPVFDAIVRSGVRLFQGVAVTLRLVKGERLERVAFAAGHASGVTEDFMKVALPLDDSNFPGRAILRREPVHTPDVLAVGWTGEGSRRNAERMGYRAIAVAPMLRENRPLGAIAVTRAAPGPFSEREIALLRTFADQAVIAIENLRLLNETRDALERQTATAEILKVISSSPTDVHPVFEAIIASASRLAGGCSVNLSRVVGEELHLAAYTRVSPAKDEILRSAFPVRLSEARPIAEAVRRRSPLVVTDHETDPLGSAKSRDVMRARGFRSTLYVPIVHGDAVLGVMHVSQVEPGPFPQQSVELLTTFADQAAIAIENVRLFNETKEALDQQRASAEVLSAISSSIADARPVFDKILERCQALFGGRLVGINVVGEDGRLGLAAYQGPGREALERVFPLAIDRESGSGRSIVERRVIHYPDAQHGADVPDATRRGCAATGIESVIFAPMLWEERGIGAIFLGREHLGSFSEKEIALLKTFADQAVIAIQNARLFNETKEALEQQTATAEILRVMSSSPTDVQPVFEAIVQSGIRLFENAAVAVIRPEGGQVRLMAIAERDPQRAEMWRGRFPFPLTREYMHGAAILDCKTVDVPDVLALTDRFQAGKQNFLASGYRAMTVAPMVRDGVAIGTISVIRMAPGPLSEKQLELLQTFADQAVIAIENVRLFNETKEALERQTATAEILKVISSSPADVQPVFEEILRAAARLCDSSLAAIFRFDGKLLHLAANHNWSAEALARVGSEYPMVPKPDRISGRIILSRQVVRIDDTLADPGYDQATAKAGGWRRMLGVPMLRDGAPIGEIVVAWREPGSTPERQVELLQTFAGQAALAIENVRLFNETKEALEQQKASAEVLQVISSSVADTAPVFDKILESCERLFVGQHVGINLVGEDGAVHLGPYRGPRRTDLERIFPLPLSHESASGAAILERRVMHYPDTERGAEVPEPVRRAAKTMGFKSAIFAPMLWEGRAIGAIWVNREFTGPFSEKEIALLKTFADQAVIAIQNARLFREIQEKSHQLEIADQHKSAFLANMSHELRTPLNAVIGFSEMLTARYFGDLTAKQAEYVGDIHASGKHLLSLINDILDLSKIEAGRMELELDEFDLPAALDNALTLVRERAQRGGVALRLEADPGLRAFRADERKLKQVMLNLLSNAVKFTPGGGSVTVVAKRVDGNAEIAVSDTGVGIVPEDQEAIFEAFRQVGTDVTRKREGTGLGLALARRFVELHGGTIGVASAPGKGSTFTVTLPLRHGE